MSPFEALYGRKCRTPLNWTETGDGKVFGPDILLEAEKQVKFIQDRLKMAQSRQKSYADNKRRDVNFQTDNYVYLRVTALKEHNGLMLKGNSSQGILDPLRLWIRKDK